MSKLIKNLTDIIIDGSKIADKNDLFKNFFMEHDEILSSSCWGKLLKHMSEKAYVIADLNEAYYFTLYTAYLNTFSEALEHFVLKENNFAIPCSTSFEFNYNEFDEKKIYSNNLKLYFDEIFKDFLKEEDQSKVQKYINNHLKYNYYKVLKNESLVLKEYIKHKKSELGLEDQKKFKKEVYKKRIEQEFLETVLDDQNGLTLSDLYIEPYFRIHKKCLDSKDERYQKMKSYHSKYIDVEDESIHDFIEDILTDKNIHNLNCNNVNTVFIAGQPGQGKSSFTKKFVNDIVNDNLEIKKDIIFIKLKDISEPTELLNGNIKDIIQNHTNFEIDDFNNYIIVLDGLDELAMKTGLTLPNIDTICQRLGRTDITVLITTRHGYVNFDSLNEKNIVIVELKELQKEQQISWINNYKKTYPLLKFTEEIIENIHNDKKKNEHLLELINQPILLHMIVSMDIEDINNLTKTKLYENFFDILIQRNWEKTQHPLSDGIEEEEYKFLLKNMLKELAFNIYNSDYEYIHKIEFEKLSSVLELQELLFENSNNESLKTNLKGIMISFYFKEIKKDQEDDNIEERHEKYAIEFLHKSLMEYMVSLNIYDTIFDEFLERKKKVGSYVINDGKNALEVLWNLFSQKSLSDEVIENLIDLIKINDNQEEKNELSDRFIKFMPNFIEKDFLFEFNILNEYPLDMAENTFSSFWIILSHLNNKNHMIGPRRQRDRLINKLRLLSNNSFIQLSNQDLSGLEISNFVIYEKLDTINFKDTSSYRLSIFNLWGEEYYIHKNTSLHEVKNLSSAIIKDVEFQDCIFNMDTLYQNQFDNCIFNNVSFKVDFFLKNIFRNCEFVSCPEIDFSDLEDNEKANFINCKLDGENINS